MLMTGPAASRLMWLTLASSADLEQRAGPLL